MPSSYLYPLHTQAPSPSRCEPGEWLSMCRGVAEGERRSRAACRVLSFCQGAQARLFSRPTLLGGLQGDEGVLLGAHLSFVKKRTRRPARSCDAGRAPPGSGGSLPCPSRAPSADRSQARRRATFWRGCCPLPAVWQYPVPCRAGLWAFAHAMPFACFLPPLSLTCELLPTLQDQL